MLQQNGMFECEGGSFMGKDIAVLTLVALFVRVLWHLYAPDRDWPDTAVYLETGKALLETGRMSSFNYMPLYPVLIAIFGYKHILTFQIVLSALTAGLVYLLSFELFRSRAAALFAGLIFCISPMIVFYANMRLSETVYIFLLLLACLGFYRGQFLIGSIVLVLATLTRPTLDPVAPLLIAAFCFARGEGQWKPVARRVGLYIAVYVVMMAPWWWHNWMLYHSFVRLSVSMGNLLIIENTTLFDKVGLNFEALAPAWQQFHIADPIARDKAMVAASVDYIKADPLHWLWRCVERTFRFWSPLPGSQSGLVNAVAFVSTVPVMALAVVALLRLSKAQLLKVMPLLLIVAFFTAVHAVTHGISRYRLPLEPFLMIFAGFGLASLLPAFVSRSRNQPAASH
ncbi:ArnT family glycosyltransferase [Microvirga flavescens]|uniref:ArnT family glycosyltransferase n=1 Tax=Microvirga flavescens TaxID=2249811 RepID=UPI000DDA2963|nr:hypothetical protein [Microvirga flavescens]